MKTKALLAIALLISSFSYAQESKKNFNAIWVADKNTDKEAILSDNTLTVEKTTSTWTVFSNQLNEMFKNKQVGDTLLLIYTGGEVGSSFARLYKGSGLKLNSIFAKCYFKTPKELGVIYLKPKYVKDVRAFFSGDQEKMIYPSTLYFHKKS